MKTIKLIMACFILFLALLAFTGVMSFDMAVPCIVVCSALITFFDSKRLESEKKYAEARSVKSSAMFMVMLAMVWFFYKLF